MNKWKFPELNPDAFTGGDMPGDKIEIGPSHIKRAEIIIPELKRWLDNNPASKTVISVFGGSGVGKSEIGSLLAYYCRSRGIPAYLLSGDNYPLRIPEDNDKERLRVFRYGVLQALSESETFSAEMMKDLQKIWNNGDDFNQAGNDWEIFYDKGCDALKNYLGTEKEIDFSLVNRVISDFKKGKDKLILKRMGRCFNDVKMEAVDVSSTPILIIEWTHGNNPLLKNVDFPVFLYSTPRETLAHRLSRARDKGADSPFVSLVLSLEQAKLAEAGRKAKLIVGLEGNIISTDDFLRRDKNE